MERDKPHVPCLIVTAAVEALVVMGLSLVLLDVHMSGKRPTVPVSPMPVVRESVL